MQCVIPLSLSILLSLTAGAMAAEEIAHYPLQSDALDITGLNDPITLENAPFQDGGVYCNGVYGAPPDGYLVETPDLAALDFESFAISAEFMISDHPSTRWPVFTGGRSWRWMGAAVESDGTISLLYNNINYQFSSRMVLLDTWHRVLIAYDGVTETGELYLDGTFVASAPFVIVHGEGRDISTLNYGLGVAFHGIFRQLVVYDAAFTPAPVIPSTWGSVKTVFR